MIGIEDLKDSLRQQLGALIALYEAEPDVVEATRHGGNGTRETPAPATAMSFPTPMPMPMPMPMPTPTPGPGPSASDAPGGEVPGGTEDDEAAREHARALDIETCLVAFDGAIRAAERAARVRDVLQRLAHEAIDRGSDARRVAMGLRQELQRMILACGRSLGLPGSDAETQRLAELRLALRRADGDARHADREALAARRRVERAIANASAALLAAIQADPSRGNPLFDPATARAARIVADRAAEQAASSLADATSPPAAGARVIAFGPVGGVAPARRDQ